VTTEAVTPQAATSEPAGPAQADLQRADGVELIGEMAGSGYRVPPSLARRADGQTIQLTPLLYAVLREIDGRRSPEEVSAAVSASTGRTVSEDNIRQLVDEQLRPLGLLRGRDGSQPKLKKRNPLLALRFRYAVTGSERTQRLTDPFRFLFRPWMVIPLLVAFGVVCWWVFFRKGLASAAYDAFERPGLLILVFTVTVVSAGFHEFGHAAAARYGGATPGVMGVGLYLVWPAFYTDVTDSYRLGRRGRLRTDLGGLYFNAIVAVAITGLWLWLRYDALLLVVATQILQMLRQLAPLVRFDGYHVLADLTGVPDLYGRIKPTLLGALPWRWGDPQARLLKPWARIVVTLWVLIVVPLLLSALWMAIVALPRLMGTALASLGKQQDVLSTAWADGDMVQATARVMAMAAIVITVAGVLYMLVRFARHSVILVRRGTAGRPVMRVLAGVLGAAVLAAIAYAWWPNDDTYRPIQPSERGTIGDIIYALRTESTHDPRTISDAPVPAASSKTLVPGQQGVMRALWDTRTAPPTKDSPKLALVLVRTAPSGTTVGGGGGFVTAATPDTKADQGWVFPVDKPLAPEDGDTQALAVNTADNTVEYQAALAMIYVDDGSDAMNVNEAQAYASCESCSAVAIAYQVVIVVDTDATDDNVAVPQNLAAALNYDCVNCMTYALAQQLFVTVDEPLTDAQKEQLTQIWAEMQAYEAEIELNKTPPDEVAVRLDEFTEEILDVLEVEDSDAAAATTGSQPPVSSSNSSPPPSQAASTVAPSSGEPTAPTDSTPAPTADNSMSTNPTGDNTSGASTPEGSSSTDPTAPAGSTTDGSTSTDDTTDDTTAGADSTTGGSTSDGASSGGATSGGATSP
jgi:putative peptide zinc metalloprotease protein